MGWTKTFFSKSNGWKINYKSSRSEWGRSSDKISSNQLFQHEKWRSSTTAERRAHWSWPRNSPEATLVNEMGKTISENCQG